MKVTRTYVLVSVIVVGIVISVAVLWFNFLSVFSEKSRTVQTSGELDQIQESGVVTITYPVGGETFAIGDTVTIKWNTKKIPRDSSMYLMASNGLIVGYGIDPRTGTYSWKIPAIGEATCSGFSDAVFMCTKKDFNDPVTIKAAIYTPKKACLGYCPGPHPRTVGLAKSQAFKIIVPSTSIANRELSNKNVFTDFSINIPATFEYYESKEGTTPSLRSIFMYDKSVDANYGISKAANPLLALIDRKEKYLKLDVNNSAFVKQENFDPKTFVLEPLSGPTEDVPQTLIESESFSSNDNKTTMYFYVTEIGTQVKSKRQGVVWVSHDAYYHLQDETGDAAFLKAVAKTFTSVNN